MSGVLHPVVLVDDLDLLHLDPLDRLQTLIAGENFDPRLRGEPITFDMHDPIYGYSCSIQGCAQHSTQATWWCTRHAQERLDALRSGIGEAQWKATAVLYPTKQPAVATDCRLPACRFCADRDAFADGLCHRHHVLYRQARRRAGPRFVEAAWVARQVGLPGGNCQVRNCQRRAESEPHLCLHHHKRWREAGSPRDLKMERWLFRAGGDPSAGFLFLAGLPPLLAAEIRYAPWAHAQNTSPARWHPMWLRALVKACAQAGVTSLLELNPEHRGWTPQPARVNRIVREMCLHVDAVHRTREDTRELGYLDPNYWGYRFSGRRSAFDLTPITQHCLRDLTWDYRASVLDGPRRPRSPAPFEQVRRSLICLSAYLAECDSYRATRPAVLTEATAREFVADFSRRVSNRQHVRGVFNLDGSPSVATPTTYALTMNAVRRVMRWAMDTGAATSVQLSREFIVSIPHGGALSHRNPRPFSDPVLRELSDPTTIRLLDERDPNHGVCGWILRPSFGSAGR